MRAGIDLLSETLGSGPVIERHHRYEIRLRMWLNRGDAVRWDRPWGTAPAKLSTDRTELVTCVRIDREQLINGLFYGCEGMRIGGIRKLRIAPHLAFGARGVEGAIPPDALIIAELEILAERDRE